VGAPPVGMGGRDSRLRAAGGRALNFTIARALQWWARETPTQTALRFADQPVSFAELYSWSGRVAGLLLGHGVGAGDRVGMVATNSLHYAVLAFALVRIGAIGAPLSFRSTASELEDWFIDLAPALVFTDDERRHTTRLALGAAAASKLKS